MWIKKFRTQNKNLMAVSYFFYKYVVWHCCEPLEWDHEWNGIKRTLVLVDHKVQLVTNLTDEITIFWTNE